MNTFFSTFIVGFEKVVAENLRDDLKDLEIIKLDSGLVVYKTRTSSSGVQKIPYLNNSFLLIVASENSDPKKMYLYVIKDKKLLNSINSELKNFGKTFRIVFSSENEIISLDYKEIQELENLLSNGIRLDRSEPDMELWFMQRRQGEGFVGIRITRRQEFEKRLQKGELRPQLAYLLCLLSQPLKEDVFLDPFAGHGAIVSERVKHFPFKKAFAGENDKQVFNKLKARIANTNLKITLGRWDATNLSFLTNGSVNKIVTDPPWGFYSNKEGVGEVFYQIMLGEFSRILVRGGSAVILMGQKDAFEKALNSIKNFALLEKYDVLVSGKKAAIYKLKKL